VVISSYWNINFTQYDCTCIYIFLFAA
jgi:hypothetical protein